MSRSSPTLREIHGAMIASFHEKRLQSVDKFLRASARNLAIETISTANLPLMLFRNGTITIGDWQGWLRRIQWDIPVELKVGGQAGLTIPAMQDLIDEVIGLAGLADGLTVDETGKLVTWGEEWRRLQEQCKLTRLANRVGPVLVSARVRPETPDDPFSIADLMFRVEWVQDRNPDKDQEPIVSLFHLGFSPQAIDLGTNDYRLPLTQPADVCAPGGFAEPRPDTTGPNGLIVDWSDVPHVKGNREPP